MSLFVVSKSADIKFIELLENYGEICLLSENKYLNYFESCHADMQIFKTSEKSCIVAPGISKTIESTLKNHNIDVIIGKDIISSNYPQNIKYNVLRTNNSIFHNSKHTSNEIKTFVQNNNYNFIDVKQGYSACSSLYVSFCNLIITGDLGIIRAAERNNYNVCYFEHSNEILLEGYDHGFIGGCCAVLDRGRKIIFNGNIRKYYSFYQKLVSYGIDIVDIPNLPLTDIGGAVFFS